MKGGVISATKLTRLIHEFIEKTGDKYIDGYELLNFLDSKIGNEKEKEND